jgi:branched-chain amino acid transport system substrate-binding protein
MPRFRSGHRRSSRLGHFRLDAVLEALRSNEFDTVVGRIGFDDNGDVTGTQTYIWYVWNDGEYQPAQLPDK